MQATKRVPFTTGQIRTQRSHIFTISHRWVPISSSFKYDIDVEAEPVRAPNSAPNWNSSKLPPPPPPPRPPQARASLSPLSRREMLFGALGGAIGVSVSAVYYSGKIREDLGKYEEIEQMLDDPRLLELMGSAYTDEELLRMIDIVGADKFYRTLGQ